MIGIAAAGAGRDRRSTRASSASHERLARFGLALILGGAFGNLIDRASPATSSTSSTSTGATAHFWAFNVADAAITVGAVLVLLDMIGIGRRHASHPV